MGFSIAAPVGPIGILCIQRTLSEGRMIGFATGLGAATADGLYGCVAGFGLSAISSFFTSHQFGVRVAGGLFLCYLGIEAWRTRAAERNPTLLSANLAGAYASTFFLTLGNPMTILSFSAVFASLGVIGEAQDFSAALRLVLGVFLGSAIWWLLLSFGVGLAREKFQERYGKWVNHISGIIIFGCGVLALAAARK